MRRAITLVLVLMTSAAFPLPAEGRTAPRGLQLVREVTSLTGTHRWYRQVHGGHEVLGGWYVEHLDAGGRIVDVDDGRVAVRGAAGRPAISRGTARTAAGGGLPGADLVVLRGARLAWAVYSSEGVRTLVDANSGDVIRRDLVIKEAAGRGRVFDPNPVVTLRNESLTDQKDSDYAALQPAYFLRTLTNLDGSGYLRGDFADITGTTSRAFEASLDFLYGRADERFEQVMAYHAVTGAQAYIQSLGFSDINNEPQEVRADQFGGDNSFFYPKQDFIKFGKGGVDDGEDADVIWHEYGHAMQESQVPGFGVGHDAGAIGEAFGDYWAVTMSVPVSGGFEVPCVADWDSVSYTDAEPHCLRRVDLDLTVEDATGGIHHDGQIWSRALWDIHQALGRAAADRIILEAQFSFAPDTSWEDAALDTVAAALALGGNGAAVKVRRAFEDREIL